MDTTPNVLCRPRCKLIPLTLGKIKPRIRDFSPEVHVPVPRKSEKGKRRKAKASAKSALCKLDSSAVESNDYDTCLRLVEERRMEKITSLDPPKKSLTAYTLFVKVKRQQLLVENPDAKTPDIMKQIGRLWGALQKDAKDIYKEIAD